MSKYEKNIDLLREMLAELLEKQSVPCLTSTQRTKCKEGIVALRSAIDALEVQVLA